jgi:hypothetical protein
MAAEGQALLDQRRADSDRPIGNRAIFNRDLSAALAGTLG